MKAWLLLVAVSASAMAGDADLQRCRAIAEMAGRLACYDAIPLTPVPSPAASFGLSARQLRQSDEPDTIHSTLVGRIDGWGPTTQFRLANGQIWRVNDDSSGTLPETDNPGVTITRNTLGTLFLEIDGSAQAPRVRRLH